MIYNPNYWRAKRKWRGIDYDFCFKIGTFCIGLAFVMMAGLYVSPQVKESIADYKIRVENAKLVNAEMERLYKEGEKIGEKLIDIKFLEERKDIYNEYEYKVQQGVILGAQTKLAQKICPIGTYVRLEEPRFETVRVKSLEGYQATTYEGSKFMVTEDKWRMLSRREYQVLGGEY